MVIYIITTFTVTLQPIFYTPFYNKQNKFYEYQ